MISNEMVTNDYKVYVCRICNKKLTKKQEKYCSVKCQRLSLRNRIILDCKYCKQTFILSMSGKLRKYCSRKCMGLDRRNRMEIQCKNCGKNFKVTPALIKNGKTYCSKKCLMEHHNVLKKC